MENQDDASAALADRSYDGNYLEPNGHGHMSLNTVKTTLDTGLPALGADISQWDEPDFNFADFLASPKSPSPELLKSLEPIEWPPTQWPPTDSSSTSLAHLTTSWLPQGHSYERERAAYFNNLSIPVMSMSTLRTLIQRPRMKTGRVAQLTLHTLRSYPLMMLRDGTLPPFIHPLLASSEYEDDKDVEPLTNCRSLVHMISSGVQGSRKLFWRNVRLECERLIHEVCLTTICDRISC